MVTGRQLATFLVALAISGPLLGHAQPAATMVAPIPPARPAPTPPKLPPADELVAAGKTLAGTWRCKGSTKAMDGSSTPMLGTDKVTVDLDKYWIHDSFSAPTPGGPYRFEAFTTFDATTKSWKRVMIENDGSMMSGRASFDPQKQDWDMTVDGPHGAAVFRDHVDLSDLKTGLKMWGEISLDKSKTWLKVYEETCKK